LDLSQSLKDLMYASFDMRTVWPPAERMPAGYDWKRIMELGKNPGLGVRQLHAKGITGRGVGIGMIDARLLVDHQEYAERIRLYEENGLGRWLDRRAEMHGAATASIAVGKTVGVAPEADLYYIGAPVGGLFGSRDFTLYAKSVHRLLEINKQLPPDRKIRVIAMQVGWSPTEAAYAEMKAAAAAAKDAGMLVISSSVEETHGFAFHGLGRDPLADPELAESYRPGLWWEKMFYAGRMQEGCLLVPMDSRATAGPGAKDDYAFYRAGGWSWSIPYIAGLYALAVQVDPTITPDRFWKTALQTGRTIQIQHEGKEYSFGRIVDPPALIEAIGGR
ncbi:MAG: peptidase S8, partial [Bacillota bacterium]